MADARALAAAYGVRVELANLGDWAHVTLAAEYDPNGPVIRVNERALWRILRQAQDDKSTPADKRARTDKLVRCNVESTRPDVDTAQPNVTLSLSKGAPLDVAIEHAIAHEVYHHREAIGDVARIADRAARERAADAFADAFLAAR